MNQSARHLRTESGVQLAVRDIPAAWRAGDRRPEGVPAVAEWFFEAEEWLWCQRDAEGELHGSLRTWRADGKPWLEYEYAHGKRHGAFNRFYPSGALAQSGRYFDDLPDGLWTSLADDVNTYSIRECCIPEGTRAMKQEYRRGKLLAEAFYDATGEVLEYEDASPISGRLPEPLRERETDVLARGYDFWPESEPLDFDVEPLASVEQSLSSMRDAIQRAALRVQAMRSELIARDLRVPPDVSALIEEAAPASRRFSFPSEDDATLLVQVDETVSPYDMSTEDLIRRARLEWMALCWLCWATGLDSVGLPDELTPRPELYAALTLASQRAAALSGYDLQPDSAQHFHGLDESHLPASALAHLADQYREMRAVLLFASDPECQSPWQDDLGRA